MSEMNIQNISILDRQLKAIGFDKLGHTILKHICLAPTNFSIIEKLLKVPETISFIFHFEKDLKTDIYNLVCYDAVLQQQVDFDFVDINGLNVKGIDESMAKIDWKEAFDFSERKPFNPDDKTGYETERMIADVIRSLHQLSVIEDGKAIAISLKQRYWHNLPINGLMGEMSNGKNKSDIIQRFYFSEGQPVISADEAYRFLLNRCMEKQMQIKRKQHENADESAGGEPDKKTGGSLLRKKRIGSSKKSKSTQG